MFTSSPLGLDSSGSHYKIRTRQQVLRERPIPPERAGRPPFALGSAWATSAANSFECHRRAEETDRPSRDLQAQGLRRQMSGWPENWAQARPTSAARDRRPTGPFLGRRPSATPSAPGRVPGTGSCCRAGLSSSSHGRGAGCRGRGTQRPPFTPSSFGCSWRERLCTPPTRRGAAGAWRPHPSSPEGAFPVGAQGSVG